MVAESAPRFLQMRLKRPATITSPSNATAPGAAQEQTTPRPRSADRRGFLFCDALPQSGTASVALTYSVTFDIELREYVY